uniref:DDE Tnp4 domain-containing protein n=1 Tax=Bactrocera latifrons TaxID=174628 RepID=A0A0K8TY97_BACLA
MPSSSKLKKSNKVLPYAFIGDHDFQMHETLLKPYPGTYLTSKERIFNYRINRARRIVENVFGILVSRFGVLQTTIAVSPEKAQTIVLACCYLHNFLRAKKIYSFSDRIDNEVTSSGDLVIG